MAERSSPRGSQHRTPSAGVRRGHGESDAGSAPFNWESASPVPWTSFSSRYSHVAQNLAGHLAFPGTLRGLLGSQQADWY